MGTRAESEAAAIEAAVASLLDQKTGAGSDTEFVELAASGDGHVYVRGVVDVPQLVREALLAFGV